MISVVCFQHYSIQYHDTSSTSDTNSRREEEEEEENKIKRENKKNNKNGCFFWMEANKTITQQVKVDTWNISCSM